MASNYNLQDIIARIKRAKHNPFRVQLAVADDQGRTHGPQMDYIRQREKGFQKELAREARKYNKTEKHADAEKVKDTFAEIGVEAYMRNFPNTKAFRVARNKKEKGQYVHGDLRKKYQQSKQHTQKIRAERKLTYTQNLLGRLDQLKNKKALVGRQKDEGGVWRPQFGAYTKKLLEERLAKRQNALNAFNIDVGSQLGSERSSKPPSEGGAKLGFFDDGGSFAKPAPKKKRAPAPKKQAPAKKSPAPSQHSSSRESTRSQSRTPSQTELLGYASRFKEPLAGIGTTKQQPSRNSSATQSDAQSMSSIRSILKSPTSQRSSRKSSAGKLSATSVKFNDKPQIKTYTKGSRITAPKPKQSAAGPVTRLTRNAAMQLGKVLLASPNGVAIKPLKVHRYGKTLMKQVRTSGPPATRSKVGISRNSKEIFKRLRRMR